MLAGLLRFDTSKSGDTRASLSEVVARMQPSQKDIYFIAAENKEAAQSSPFVERLGKKDLEVCLRPPVSSILCWCPSAHSWKRVRSVRCMEHRAPNPSHSGSCHEKASEAAWETNIFSCQVIAVFVVSESRSGGCMIALESRVLFGAGPLFDRAH